RELPRIEVCFDDQVLGAQGDAPASRVDRPWPRVGPFDHVTESLRRGQRPRRRAYADDAWRDRAHRHARGGEQLRDALEFDARWCPLPAECPDDSEIAGLHGLSLDGPEREALDQVTL